MAEAARKAGPLASGSASAGLKTGPVEILEREVLPALFERLPEALPEFGFRACAGGWRATNEEATRRLWGVRADRVQAYANTPFGVTVHGRGFATFVSLEHDGGRSTPRGAEFMDVLKRLAAKAGVDASRLDRKLSPEDAKRIEARHRAQDLRETYHALSKAALAGESAEAAPARAYLAGRGFDAGAFDGLPFGLHAPKEIGPKLLSAGYPRDELRRSGLFADSRWKGRVVFPLRDERGRIASFAARDVTGEAEDSCKYLYLAGASKPPFFGLDVALRDPASRRRLAIVEGPVDAVRLQHLGFPGVVAIGGDGRQLTAERLAALGRLGVEQVTLVLDNDPRPDGAWPGREGTLACLRACVSTHRQAAVNAGCLAEGPPEVFVVDPALLGDAKDPDELVARKGLDAFREVLARREAGPVFLAREILASISPSSPDDARRDAATKLMDLVAGLRGERSLLDAEDVLRLAAESTGYSLPALREIAERARERAGREETRRKLKGLVAEAAAALGAHDADETSVVGALREGLAALTRPRRGAEPLVSVSDETAAHEVRLERWRGGEFIGLPQKTLKGLDEATLGLRGMMLLAAPPNAGKTVLGVQLGTDVVLANPDACFLFVSLEMTRWDVMTRIKCRLAGLDWKELVFGTQRGRGRGRQALFTADELGRIRAAEETLSDIGRRMRILDARNSPEPTVDGVLHELRRLKALAGATRAFVLVDYVQVWPVPPEEAPNVRSDLDADRWRMGAMKELRDAGDGDAVLVISEARKPSGRGSGPWGADLADVMGSARGSYTPDMVFLLQPFGKKRLVKALGLGEGSPEEEVRKRRAELDSRGLAYHTLAVAKARDGARRGSFDLTFRYRRSTFEEGVRE